MTNVLFMPLRYYRPGIKPVGDIYVRDDHIYLIDDKGDVHTYVHAGVNINTTGRPHSED